jgi:hypothetical protein
LLHIVTCLDARNKAGAATTLVKVKSHSGQRGNEAADALAKQAVRGDCTEAEVTTPLEELTRFGWQTSGPSPTPLRDADDVLKAVTAARVAALIANQPNTTAAKWAKSATKDKMLAEFSHNFMSSREVPHRYKRLLLQLRSGRWIANGLLHKWNMKASPRCPYCPPKPSNDYGKYDDGWHVASCCTHPVLKGKVTFRHDAAMHRIVDAIQKSHHELPFCLNVSAGRRFQDKDAPITDTIPPWALPGNRLQPDLVLILGWQEGMPIPAAPTRDVCFVIGDGCFSKGTNCEQTILKKQQKYAPVIHALRQRGWSVRTTAGPTCDAATPGDSPFVFFLGTTAEIYASTLNSMRAFGIDKDRIKPLAFELHILATKHTCDILNTRRAIDKSASTAINSLSAPPIVTGEGGRVPR